MNENFTQIGFEAFLFANKAVPIAGAEITDDELFRRVKAFEKRLGELLIGKCLEICEEVASKQNDRCAPNPADVAGFQIREYFGVEE